MAPRTPPADPTTQRARAGSLAAPLTRVQKRALVTAARAAWLHHGGARTGMEFEAWRHEQQAQACGVASLREARQEHYKLLRGHFDQLTGRPVSAFRMFVGAEGDAQARELALAKLEHECRRLSQPRHPASPFAGPTAARWYAEGFLLRYRKTKLERASSTEIWHAIWTLRRKVGVGGDKRPGRGQRQGSAKTRQNAILAGGERRPAPHPENPPRAILSDPQTTANVPPGAR
jgi:hypothetical protein